jgi:hypothetical protein
MPIGEQVADVWRGVSSFLLWSGWSKAQAKFADNSHIVMDQEYILLDRIFLFCMSNNAADFAALPFLFSLTLLDIRIYIMVRYHVLQLYVPQCAVFRFRPARATP